MSETKVAAFRPPLPPEHPDAPKYWRYETTGVLAPVVEAYLRRPRSMTLRDIATMRAYLKQWIGSPAWDMNPHASLASRVNLSELRKSAAAIASVEDIHVWIELATRVGLDPL